MLLKIFHIIYMYVCKLFNTGTTPGRASMFIPGQPLENTISASTAVLKLSRIWSLLVKLLNSLIIVFIWWKCSWKQLWFSCQKHKIISISWSLFTSARSHMWKTCTLTYIQSDWQLCPMGGHLDNDWTNVPLKNQIIEGPDMYR